MTDINNCEPADPYLLDFRPPLPLNLFNIEDNTAPPVPESGIVMESEIIGVYEEIGPKKEVSWPVKGIQTRQPGRRKD